MSILYIDDDLEDIEIFNDAVKTVDPGINCISSTSAKEALQLLNNIDKPDHIVLDINMPGMDGKVCLQELRKNPKFDRVNVIVYSTNSFPKDIEQIESLGATFVRKATSFNALCTLIRQLAEGEFVGRRK